MSNLKAQANAKNKSVIQEENTLLKQMIMEKDSSFKKLKEAHSKELLNLELEKQSAAEALGNATRENTKMQDKETILLDLFKNMKKFMEAYNEKESISNTKPSVVVETPESVENKSVSITTSHAPSKMFKCNLCDFSDTREGNVTNHKIVQHSVFKCHICDYESTTGESLDYHLDNEHFTPQFKCTTCNATFHTERMLKEHSRKHNVIHKEHIVCDYCGFKAESFSTLDNHIETFHKITGAFSRNASAARKDTNRKVFTFTERLKNGLCRFWTQGSCKYAENCKYAHIKVCHYQSRCKSAHTCNYFHHSGINSAFLENKTSVRHTNRLNPNVFPPLSRQ